MAFGRLMTAMVTPFDEQGQINWEQTAFVINHLIEEQLTESIVICGTTGESPTLTEEEKLALFSFALQTANGRCRIIAGTGTNDTAHSIHLSREAEKIGVHGLLLVAPYYNRPTQEGLYQHFKHIAESVQLPIMIYNIPGRTGVNIEAATTIRLSHISNIFAVKEADQLNQIAKVISGAAENFKVYCGDDCMTLPTLAIGGYGVVSIASHLAGRQIRAMIDAHLNGHTEEAAMLHRKLLPLFDGLFICPNPVPLKYALSLNGIDVGSVRLPLVEANDQEKSIIANLFS